MHVKHQACQVSVWLGVWRYGMVFGAPMGILQCYLTTDDNNGLMVREEEEEEWLAHVV